MSAPLPPSLRTATPEEGLALARQLTDRMLTALPTTASMADHLKTSANRPAPELIMAIYFHAISLANTSWTRG